MKLNNRLLYLAKLFLFWILVFITQKILFLFYNYHESFQLGVKDWFLIVVYGLKLDFSVAAYLLIIPTILTGVSVFLPGKFMKLFTSFYTYLFLFVILYLGVVDMALYSYWGFKLDITPLLYIKTPGDALASVSIGEIIFLLGLFAILFIAFLILYRRYFIWPENENKARWYLTIPLSLFGIVILFIIARGGIGIAAMNLSRVYFHKERFANHSAINVAWNTLYSYIERNKLQESFHFMDSDEAEQRIGMLKLAENHDSPELVRPGSNIVLIILESFSNKIISELGGENGVTPCIDSLCRNSIVFSNFYASGDRSDKGLVSIFSGYPAQPTTSIIDYPSKSQKLPFLYRNFTDAGYETAFYYGGDLNFANFKSYFSNPALKKVITRDDFSKKEQLQKWGVPDGILFQRLLADLERAEPPFFYSCFTLSSHEPFDVPMDPVFGTKNRDELSKNGFYYTDQEVGSFLNKARKTSWWENTLIIITADHGSRSPGNTANHSQEKFRIPMIWTGGAVQNSKKEINKIGSQVDIPATLLSQFKLENSDYPFSKDLLNDGEGYAFYAFNNGFGFATDEGYVIYDNDFNKCLLSQGELPESTLETGKAYLQVLSDDFISKK